MITNKAKNSRRARLQAELHRLERENNTMTLEVGVLMEVVQRYGRLLSDNAAGRIALQADLDMLNKAKKHGKGDSTVQGRDGSFGIELVRGTRKGRYSAG
jgi:hypothetical protein